MVANKTGNCRENAIEWTRKLKAFAYYFPLNKFSMVWTLISHRDDVKMFKTQMELQGAGQWFHSKVLNIMTSFQRSRLTGKIEQRNHIDTRQLTGACNFHKFVSRRFHGLEFTFRTTVSARILNIFKFHKPVSKTNRPNYDIFCLLLTFLVFLMISYTSNALIDMLKILFLREKEP